MENRILIADDDSRVLESLSMWLSQYPEFGRVLVAKSGREAVDKAQRYSPDLIILDLSMPGMDGLEAARWIHKAHPDLPIVLLTFHGAEVSLMNGAGISAVVSKDQAGTKLLGTLRELVQVRAEVPAAMAQ